MNIRRKLSSTEKEEIILHFENGRPAKEIAADFNVHPAYVRVFARRNNADFATRRANKPRWPEIEKEIAEIMATFDEPAEPSPTKVSQGPIRGPRGEFKPEDLREDKPGCCLVDISGAPGLMAAFAAGAIH